MGFGDRCKGYVVDESVAMLMEVDESGDKLLVGEREIWVEKGDEISGGSGSGTRVRRRAGSKSGSGLLLGVMTNQDDLIAIAPQLSVFVPQTWDRRIWGSARGAG